jgi:hypothetical protein
MRKTVPFIATALVSVMITAGIMQASAGAQVEPTFRAVGPASDVFGVGLRITPCNSSPNNANEWQRFSRCSRSNFTAIQKWATRLDNCMVLYEMRIRDDDLYSDGGGLGGSELGDGLAPGPGNPDHYLMEWRKKPNCPRS